MEGIGGNTINVVNRAIELRTKNDFDRVWAVFDKDSFSDNKFNSAITKAQNNHIGCAWSNEAFELWYLYHFQNRITAMSRDEYKKAISKAVNESQTYNSNKQYVYAKNDPSNYSIMRTYGSMENAIRWAEAKSNEYDNQRYALHNPCTMVYKLVCQLLCKDEVLNNEIRKKVNKK